MAVKVIDNAADNLSKPEEFATDFGASIADSLSKVTGGLVGGGGDFRAGLDVARDWWSRNTSDLLGAVGGAVGR